MFRKILLLILLITGFSGSAQKVDPDYECFDVEIDLNYHRQRDDNNNPIKDSYVVCRDQRVAIPPLLEVEYLRRTDQYEVQSIPYDPFPVTGGTDIWGSDGPGMPYDDGASCVVELPFKFCFFDRTYEKIIVWSNGVVVFYDDDEECPYIYPIDRHSYPPGTSPPGGPYGMAYMPDIYYAGIMGTYQHTHWNINEVPEGRIFYEVYGEAPCRKFVVTFYNMPPAGLFPQDCPPPAPLQHHQIVLHETWNVVDVNIIQHNACPAIRPDDASAIVGILSHDGSEWNVPTIRDFGPWDAEQESWCLAPTGKFLFNFEWYVDGVLETFVDGNSDDLSLELTVDKLKNVRADLVVETCDIGFDQRY